MQEADYDDGNESPLNETSSESTGASVRLMKTNELRNEVDLPPLPSKRQLLRQQREDRQSHGPLFEDAEQDIAMDQGSADEEEGRIIFSDDDQEPDEDGQIVVFHETAISRKTNPMDLDNTQARAGEATCEKLDGLLKMASNLAQGPREEAILLRQKTANMMHFLQSQGHSVDDLNNHLRENNMIPNREVDDNDMFIIQKKRDHATMNQVFEETGDGRIQLNKSLRDHAQTTSSSTNANNDVQNTGTTNKVNSTINTLSWKDIACGGLTGAQPNDALTRAGTSMRVSALDPSRLQLKPDDVPTRVDEPLGLCFKPTVDNEMILNDDNVTAIAPPIEFLKSARDNWNTSLVGYYAGTSLPFEKTKAKLFNLWGNSGLQRVFYNPKGFYILKFESVIEKDMVLKLGSVFIEGRVIFLRPWMEGTNFKRNVITQIPVWVKFVNVPHSYWCMEGLSYLASAIGVPISLDKPTANLEPMKFARVCVNISANHSRPKQIYVPVLSDNDGSIVRVKVEVEYPILPPSCSICKCFGHPLSKCTNNPTSTEPANASHRSGKEPATPALNHDEPPRVLTGPLIIRENKHEQTQPTPCRKLDRGNQNQNQQPCAATKSILSKNTFALLEDVTEIMETENSAEKNDLQPNHEPKKTTNHQGQKTPHDQTTSTTKSPKKCNMEKSDRRKIGSAQDTINSGLSDNPMAGNLKNTYSREDQQQILSTDREPLNTNHILSQTSTHDANELNKIGKTSTNPDLNGTQTTGANKKQGKCNDPLATCAAKDHPHMKETNLILDLGNPNSSGNLLST